MSVERSEISTKEIQIASEFGRGATPTEIIWQNLKLPEDVEGLVFIDVAAGLSPLVATLLEKGADAYGIDPIYGSSVDEINEMIQEAIWNTLDSAPPLYRWNMKYMMEMATSAFKGSYLSNKDRYQKGYATVLPFPDNFADYIVSVSGLSGLIMEDPELFTGALREALRVIKPGGKVILSPWFADPLWGPEACEIHAKVLEELLKDENIRAEVEVGIPIETDVPVDSGSRLVLTKLN